MPVSQPVTLFCKVIFITNFIFSTFVTKYRSYHYLFYFLLFYYYYLLLFTIYYFIIIIIIIIIIITYYYLFFHPGFTRTNHSIARCVMCVWTNVSREITSVDQIQVMMNAVSAWR